MALLENRYFFMKTCFDEARFVYFPNEKRPAFPVSRGLTGKAGRKKARSLEELECK
jgi:hypothetical protein